MRKLIIPSVLLSIASTSAVAQWNPRPGWGDSYAVDGVCYCDSNGDHGIENKTADTPIGRLPVLQICADIRSSLGTGSGNGRIPYNDIQCGNGPANDAADERGCPGRVDIGSAGCDVIGPKWDLEAVYGGGNDDRDDDRDDDNDSDLSGTTAAPNGNDARFAVDGNRSTRWTTETVQSPGQVFQLDLGRTETIGKVILDSDRSGGDDPAGYSLSTSTDGRDFTIVAAGSGQGGITEINFREHAARYVRITQTGSKSRNWWSIHEINVSRGDDNEDDNNEDDNNTGDDNDNSGDALDRSNWSLIASSSSSRDSVSNAIDDSTSSRWSTGQTQRDGQWFEIDLSRSESFNQIVLDNEGSSQDSPREYRVQVSNNGSDWATVDSGRGDDGTTTMTFSRQTARYIRIEQEGSSDRFWWSIHEVNVYQ